MTDRELLESMQAQVDAHLAPPPPPVPVDCVWSDWSPWSEWSPWTPAETGLERRTRTRTRTEAISAQHGGELCIGPAEETETETRPIGVPPPSPDPTALVWPSHWSALPSTPPAGWMTIDEAHPEDPPGTRRMVVEGQWHDSAAGNLDESRHEHLGVCVPERIGSGIYRFDARVKTFHWNGHNSTMVGMYDTQFDGLSRTHFLQRNPGEKPNSSLINTLIAEHEQNFYFPVLVDTRPLTTSGWKAFVLRTDIFRNSDHVHHLLTLTVPVYVDNGLPVKHSGATAQAVGWMTEMVDVFGADGAQLLTTDGQPVKYEVNTRGYLEAHFLGWDPANANAGVTGPRRFVDDPVAAWYLRSSTGTGMWPLTALACVNPNLHAHPPVYGSVLFDGHSFTSSSQTKRVDASSMTAGDRLMVRVSDSKPPIKFGSPVTLPDGRVGTAGQVADPHNAVATLLVMTLGRAKA